MIAADLNDAKLGNSQVNAIYLGSNYLWSSNRNLLLTSSNPTPSSNNYRVLPTAGSATIATATDPAVFFNGQAPFSLVPTTTTAPRLCTATAQNITFAPNQPYTMSIHTRRYPGSFVIFRMGYIISAVNYYAEFYVGNFSQLTGLTPSYVNSTSFYNPSTDSASIVDIGNSSWSRASFTFTLPFTATPSEIYLIRKPFSAVAGDGIYYYGPQLERGPAVSPYVAT